MPRIAPTNIFHTMEHKTIKLSRLVGNKGQIEGLPENPRLWDDTDVQNLATSLEESPLLAEARPMLVVASQGKYVVLGGNLRLSAYRKLNADEAPCIVLDKGMSIEKLKEVVMKDNSSFGDWDTDELANKWQAFDLSAWGVDVAGLGEAAAYTGTNKEINTDDWKEDMTLRLRFTPDEMAWVRQRMSEKDPKVELLNALGYEG